MSRDVVFLSGALFPLVAALFHKFVVYVDCSLAFIHIPAPSLQPLASILGGTGGTRPPQNLEWGGH